MRRQRSERPYLKIIGATPLPVIRQTTASECALTCVAMLANYHGLGADLVELRKQYSSSPAGATLKGITAICARLRLATRAVTCAASELRQLRTPCVLHWRFNHFVVLKSAGRKHVVLHDPARGRVKEPYDRVAEAFTGVAMEVSRSSSFRATRPPPKLRLSGLLPRASTLLRTLSAGLVLALVCELLVLATPFYLQIVIDEVLVKGDALLLNTLAAGFAVMLVFQVMANTMRQLTFQYLSQVSVFDITARILNKLLKLPLSYFRDRELGDVQHRVQSLRRVQSFVVHSAPALLLDLLFITLILVLMLAYESRLTLLVLVVTAVWCLWRALLLPLRLRLSNDIAVSESSVETYFLETLRAVQTVKLANGEATRLSEWRNSFANGINDKIRAGNLAVLNSAIRQLLFQGLRVGCIYLLAQRALAGQISIGMVSAYVAYLGMFITRANGIVERSIEYKLLEVPLGRLSDIVFTKEEPVNEGVVNGILPSNDVELKHVAFAHSGCAPWLLQDCSLYARKNGFVAIAGCSGTGKSTLLRVIAGIESASAGEILVGGIAVKNWCVRDLRAYSATVFHEDRLLQGSIADNIALFAEKLDLERVRRAARMACIDVEIEALPMGYQSRVGDLGSSLSRGQVQRVLLARAFYREPRLLLLDEATSGLDEQLERRVIKSITELDATRIVITHSDRMLEAADQVLWLHNGTLLSSRPELNV